MGRGWGGRWGRRHTITKVAVTRVSGHVDILYSASGLRDFCVGSESEYGLRVSPGHKAVSASGNTRTGRGRGKGESGGGGYATTPSALLYQYHSRDNLIIAKLRPAPDLEITKEYPPGHLPCPAGHPTLANNRKSTHISSVPFLQSSQMHGQSLRLNILLKDDNVRVFNRLAPLGEGSKGGSGGGKCQWQHESRDEVFHGVWLGWVGADDLVVEGCSGYSLCKESDGV